ncbi:nucleobase:cation symporter-2 family protein [Nakamurella leprariae]|uniref:Purine permease n=1 Tax=Nakamurella leprariae TaxID=2803911 RepID=A0A938Y8M8_9ACTN|nr:nucleobase:cation symporter-2 family protein [Nakamurella leprariae]MBM9467865.1 purine permease [Nakamurella leprariae]
MSVFGRTQTRDGRPIDPVDQVPPLAQLIPLGLQHVLAMYAGAVAVPLVVGGALIAAGRMDAGDLGYLVTADLFVAGIATLIQSIGFKWFGVKLPLMQGCTFAAVSPMIVIGSEYGVTAIYGSVIASGIFMMVLAPLFAKLVRFFPPLVTGTVILIIGLSLMGVAANWIGGGQVGEEGAPIGNVAMAAFVLVLIILLERFAPPVLARVSVLLGIVIGTLVAIPFGMTGWEGVGDAAWFGVSTPFHFGLPVFEVSAVVSMCIVALVIMTETTGDILAVGEIVRSPVDSRRLADGLRADGLSTAIGGVFNTFPYTAFAQNVGLVSITGVRSRYVATLAGLVLIVLGVIPKVGAIVEGIPLPVLGGAGIALFGMVSASGVRTLSTVRFDNRNILVVAVSIGVALVPVVRPTFYDAFPTWFTTIFESGISAGAIVAILLNLLLNRTPTTEVAAGYAAHDAVREQPPVGARIGATARPE